MKKRNNQEGFSLIELMVVIAIIGTLAGIAIPKFTRFQARARQVEAKTSLATLYTLQEAYYSDQESYANVPLTGRNGAVVTCLSNTVGFKMTPCNDKLRYGIRATVGGLNTWVGDAYTGTGVNNRVVPGCAIPDYWQMNENHDLTRKFDSVAMCL